MSKQTKKITLESLAATMEAGFKRMDKGFKDAKEDNKFLARMVANGFEHTASKEDITELKTEVVTLQTDVSDMKLRVDSLAPYFEVKHLERRVKRLEDRAGIRHTVQH